MVSQTPVQLVRTAEFQQRRTRRSWLWRKFVRRASYSSWSACWPPSTSTTRRASRQRKSRISGSNATCRFHPQPPRRSARRAPHKRASASVSSRRSVRARWRRVLRRTLRTMAIASMFALCSRHIKVTGPLIVPQSRRAGPLPTLSLSSRLCRSGERLMRTRPEPVRRDGRSEAGKAIGEGVDSVEVGHEVGDHRMVNRRAQPADVDLAR